MSVVALVCFSDGISGLCKLSHEWLRQQLAKGAAPGRTWNPAPLRNRPGGTPGQQLGGANTGPTRNTASKQRPLSSSYSCRFLVGDVPA